MPPKLPSNLITQIKPLILPYVSDPEGRKDLFIETYFLRDPRPLDQINFEGTADGFTVRCIADLISKIGCLAEEGERQHALSALLLTIRARCGVEKHAEIDSWLPILNDQCFEPGLERTKPAPVSAIPQTVATPRAERTASVFISYSHADEAFAMKLITDLGAAGHTCWIDQSSIKGGTDWRRAICDGINLSYAVVVVCTHTSLESQYVQEEIEWARTRRKVIIPVLLEDVTGDDGFFGLHRNQGLRFDKLTYSQAVADLIATLPAPPQTDATTPHRPSTQREQELAYLDRLRFDDFRLERFELAEYAPLGGLAQPRRDVRDSWEALAMQQEFALIRGGAGGRGAEELDSPPEAFTDAVSKITELRRAVVLGEPGAGKTHTLRAIAKPLYTAALADPTAPIPLMVKLGNWDQADEAFPGFIQRALGDLGPHLEALFAANRAVLLLDGLNEFPADQRATKYPQVEAFIKAHPAVMAVVTCREADYPISLHLNKVLIRPLDPLRIRDFARRVLKSTDVNDAFFWKLVGADARRHEARFKERFADSVPDWERVFWIDEALPAEMEWKEEFLGGWYTGWDRWRALRDDPAGILTLARNPYMLRMLLDVYIQFKGVLPSNRGQIFEQFVNTLLKREKLANIATDTGAVTLTDEARSLLTGLGRVAYEMQIRRANRDKQGDLSAGTALDLKTVRGLLTERLLALAVSTSILTSGDEVRFSHQLLQEYFAARYMDAEIQAGRLQATDIWKPEQWWERTNWEEAAVLLAGLYSDDCTPVLRWLDAANPEVTALCLARSGAAAPETTHEELRETWLRRLHSQEEPLLARAAVGRALGMHLTDGQMLDDRPGVGLNPDGLPDVDWKLIPDDGEWVYQENKHPGLPAFQMSRYPITYAQFGAFIAADDGWRDGRWWEGLSLPEGHNSAPGDQAFKVGNHPRERVSWYDALAFCRWWSWRLGGGYDLAKINEWAVRLPTEYEWEKAARGPAGLIYPYGNQFDASKGNTSESGLKQTSAVGLFPGGKSPYQVEDLSGNVREWCLSDYNNPKTTSEDEDLRTSVWRVLRGGSWVNLRDVARAAYRVNSPPVNRGSAFGFRVVCVPPSHG